MTKAAKKVQEVRVLLLQMVIGTIRTGDLGWHNRSKHLAMSSIKFLSTSSCVKHSGAVASDKT